ncbi:MAG TPA: cell division protein SepF [Nanoarchaeota archaeon]|nr:cell division protein SepF [Nanoarchaeota archaeon]
MGLFKFLRKKEETAPMQSFEKKMCVRAFNIKDEADVMDVAQHVKLGTTIAFVKIKDRLITKEALLALKSACSDVKGEIVGLPDGWFIAAPSGIEIVKKSANAGAQIAAAVMSKAEKEKELRHAHDELAGKLTVLDEIDTT